MPSPWEDQQHFKMCREGEGAGEGDGGGGWGRGEGQQKSREELTLGRRTAPASSTLGPAEEGGKGSPGPGVSFLGGCWEQKLG